MVICYVLGCKSRSERKCENITFHTFPKDSTTRQLWIRATGRENWVPSKYARMCSKHFEQKCFRKTHHNVYLEAFSVPTLNIPAKQSPMRCQDIPKCPVSEYASFTRKKMDTESGQRHDVIAIPSTSSKTMQINRNPSLDVMAFPSTSAGMQIEKNPTHVVMAVPSTSSASMQIDRNPVDNVTPRKMKLLKKLDRQTLLAQSRKKKLAILRSKNHRLLKKNAELSIVIEKLQEKRLINQETADLLSNVHSDGNFLKTTKRKFSPEIRKFALTLHFISPRAYNFVRNSFNTCLPHTRTLARWYQSVEGEPGFSSESFIALRLLTKNSSKKFICALCFDEMAIRKSVEWDGKSFVGFVNCGDQLNNDSLPVAKEVLAFMLTCLNGSWKLPVGYFLIDGITAEQKASLVKTCIDLITDCGLDVATVTFDGCPANFSMAKLLGCQLTGNVFNPVFLHKNKKIAIFPDPSHMLKLVRNTLGDKENLTNAEGQIVSWRYLKLLQELQEGEGFHLANKLRGAHIRYKKQIMKVKLAAQLFSESVAEAIEFSHGNIGLHQFDNCEATVDFIRKFNTLFDILNTRNLNSYGFKKPLKISNYETIKQFLEAMFDYIKLLKMDNRNILDTERKTGFLGFMLCIKSVFFLYEEFVASNKLEFLSTYKLSQDHLEIFFSAIRAKGGFNNNPTARQFKAAYKRMLVHGELKHLNSGNCVPLTDINILTCTKPEIAINNTTDRNRLVENDSDYLPSIEPEIILSQDHDYLANPTRLTEFAEHVIVYIAGFVVKALKNQIKCEQCLNSLISNEKLVNSLQYKKDKGGLHYPSDSVVKLCKIAEEIYRKNKIHNRRNPLHYLIQECLKKCIGLNLFSQDHDFTDQSIFDSHYSLLIKAICRKYLNVRIHYATKSLCNKDENIRNFYTKLILFKGQ